MKLRYWFAALAGALVLAAGAAAAAIPGPQRAICPQCYGLTDLGANIFTDAPERGGELTQLVATADAVNTEFFGDLWAHPRFIFCAHPQCVKTFGGGPAGVTYGWFLVAIAPQGFAPNIVTHERLHAELAARTGIGALLGDTVPVWFNEGLATWIAGDNRFPGPFTAADIAWIKHGETRAQWNKLLKDRGWEAGYGAAEAAIADLDHRLGPARLRAVAMLLAAGESLDDALIVVGAQ